MGILVFYESICQVFIINTNVVEVEIKKKVQLYYLFILYNYINIYKYIHNTCIFNYSMQVNYIVRYIYFIDFSHFLRDNSLDS